MQYVWFKAACSVKSYHHISMFLELELLPPEFPYNAASLTIYDVWSNVEDRPSTI
jgi:hypothetical protein